MPASRDTAAVKKRLEELQSKLAEADAAIRKSILSTKDSSRPPQPDPPAPIARWTFEGSLEDEIGGMHGEARGGARIENGALVLDGKSAYVATRRATRDLTAKTLEAWVRLDDLGQRGGAPISVQNVDGGQFDAIVFGEKEPGQWMAGSNSFARWQSFRAEEEKEAQNRFVHVAITYTEDGTITAYRNGVPYGKPYQTGRSKYLSNNHQVLFGLRHGTSAAGGRMLRGRIDRAQLYDRALSAEEIALSANVRVVTEAELVAKLRPAQKKTREEWKAEIAELSATIRKSGRRKSTR